MNNKQEPFDLTGEITVETDETSAGFYAYAISEYDPYRTIKRRDAYAALFESAPNMLHLLRRIAASWDEATAEERLVDVVNEASTEIEHLEFLENEINDMKGQDND